MNLSNLYQHDLGVDERPRIGSFTLGGQIRPVWGRYGFVELVFTPRTDWRVA